jgi:hypothetical protein
VGKGDRDVERIEGALDGPLVLGVGEREEQAHGYGFGLQSFEPPDRAREALRVERLDDGAAGADALGEPEAHLARDERRGAHDHQVVDFGAGLPAYLDHVFEARGGDERGARALAFEQGVGRDRRPVNDLRRLYESLA